MARIEPSLTATEPSLPAPFVSKALDTYVAQLYSPIWMKNQAETQFQGRGSSHELAALLLTETVQYSLNSSKKPLFVLYLDAKSAFDLVLTEFLINNLFHYGIQDQGLLLINERLGNRKTVCEWDRQLMGPINRAGNCCGNWAQGAQ